MYSIAHFGFEVHMEVTSPHVPLLQVWYPRMITSGVIPRFFVLLLICSLLLFKERQQVFLHLYWTIISVFFGLTDRPVFTHQVSSTFKIVWVNFIEVIRHWPLTMILRFYSFSYSAYCYGPIIAILLWIRKLWKSRSSGCTNDDFCKK